MSKSTKLSTYLRKNKIDYDVSNLMFKNLLDVSGYNFLLDIYPIEILPSAVMSS